MTNLKKFFLFPAYALLIFAVSCTKGGTEGPGGEAATVATTFTVKGLAGAEVTLMSAAGTEFNMNFDAAGSATITTDNEAVFTRLIVKSASNEILIGRKAGGEISFEYAGGKVIYGGQKDDFIPIEIVQELIMVNENETALSSNYRQQADLYLDGIRWEPIGHFETEPALVERPFAGKYDGNGKSIHNLYVEADVMWAALFAFVKNGEISNLTLASGSVGCFRYAAGIVARAQDNSSITNCVNHASVHASANYAGGVVAQLLGHSSISKCTNYGNISAGMNEAGGVIHSSVAATVTECVNYGYVSSKDAVGGIIMTSNGTTISKCANHGKIEGGSSVGGISGSFGSPQSLMEYCVNDGLILVGETSGGGIVGAHYGGSLTHCENMGVIEYTGSDQTLAGGIGGIAGTVQHGALLSECVNRKEAVLRNMYSRVGGIAGYITEAEVNACINYADITASSGMAGGIAGENRGHLFNSVNHAEVSAPSTVGGIAGFASETSSIRGNNNKGAVSGKMFIGGIVGTNYGSCTGNANDGAVSATENYAGGVCGALLGNASLCRASRNSGDIKGAGRVGGVAGLMNENSLMEACYSVGNITGSSLVSGVCGSVEDDSSTITNCYWANYDSRGTERSDSVFYFDNGQTIPAGATKGWPNASAAHWGVSDTGHDGNWWKTLGTSGTTNYPKLWWE